MSQKTKEFCLNPSLDTFMRANPETQEFIQLVVQNIYEKYPSLLAKMSKQGVDVLNFILCYDIATGVTPAVSAGEIEAIMVSATTNKLTKLSATKRKDLILSLRMYTECFDRVINQLLNNYYAGIKSGPMPRIGCMYEGVYGAGDEQLPSFNQKIKDVCRKLQFPIPEDSFKSDKSALAAFVKYGKKAYDTIISNTLAISIPLRLYRGIKIKKSVSFDPKSIKSNSLASFAYEMKQACYFATSYLEHGTTRDDYNFYVLDTIFPPQVKLTFPGACTLQNESEIIVCERFECDVYDSKVTSYKKPNSTRKFPKITVVKCIARMTGDLPNKLTGKLKLPSK